MGLPSSDYLEYVYEQLRKEKQGFGINKDGGVAFAGTKPEPRSCDTLLRLEMQEKQAEWAQQREAMQQEAAAAAEAWISTRRSDLPSLGTFRVSV
ncbi:hypothetical protein AK812_SmicGene8526 [Symbiodinium microadriaticum]|uniref:Uncharacterized protein n=1 Tax=Symbiodinium microadriaticum TaxID=2951 RepID=A0A1Q9EKQ5_SYMMI|nr:hypothetical protein AK812_SmicGene8526 [Symbiodinium microadriaticum]